jgi:hypothetical protein
MFLAATLENKFVEIEGVLFLYCYVYGHKKSRNYTNNC